MTERTSVRFRIGAAAWMAADVYGVSGPAILLLHGIPGGRHTWRRVATALSDANQVIVPDLLGFGESSDPPGDFHAAAQADGIVRLLDDLGVSHVHVVGFDFGGPVSVALVRQIAARVETLTLVATNTFTDTPIPGALKLARVPLVGDALFFGMCSWPGLAAMWFGGVANKRALRWPRFMAELPSRRGRRWTRRIFLDSLRNLGRRYQPIEMMLPAIACPTVVVWGDRDPFFPVAVGERTAAAIPSARFELVRRCGHFVPGEHPDALAAVIRGQVERRVR